MRHEEKVVPSHSGRTRKSAWRFTQAARCTGASSKSGAGEEVVTASHRTRALPTCRVTEVCQRQQARTLRHAARGQEPQQRPRAALACGPGTEAHPQRRVPSGLKFRTRWGRSRCSVLQGELSLFDACWLPLAKAGAEGSSEKNQHLHGWRRVVTAKS